MNPFQVDVSANFKREAKALVKRHKSLAQDIANLIDKLKTDPQQGTPIGQGCYKIRLAISSKGRGKSGGARVITYVALIDDRVVLLSIYDKADQADIADNFVGQLLREAGIN